jgi:hypothetical protein
MVVVMTMLVLWPVALVLATVPKVSPSMAPWVIVVVMGLGVMIIGVFMR